MAKKEKSKDLKKEAEILSGELFALLGIGAKIDVQLNETLKIDIEPDKEVGLLIGRHGETLNAIQFFLRVAIAQKTGSWPRTVVNIGDWRVKQEEHLEFLAKQAAERAKLTGEPQYLYNLSPGQRRIIHLALSDNKDIETESEGEGEERFLVIKIKS